MNFIKKQLPHCHPRWIEEHEFLEKEIERIQNYASTFWHDYWNIIEWISLMFVLIMFALHIANIASPSEEVFKAAKFISALTLLLIWFRLYKTLRIARLFSELNVLLSKFYTVLTSHFSIAMKFRKHGRGMFIRGNIYVWKCHLWIDPIHCNCFDKFLGQQISFKVKPWLRSQIERAISHITDITHQRALNFPPEMKKSIITSLIGI